MRPDPTIVLAGITRKLLVDLVADARTPFGQATAGYAGALTMVLAQEVDRLPDRLSRESEDVAAILEAAMPLLEPALAARVAEALYDRSPADLRISTLLAINDRLRTLLIDVHAAIEELDSPEARAMDERIWEELKESTRRRHVTLG